MQINYHLSVHNSQACRDESVVFFLFPTFIYHAHFNVSSTLLRKNRNTVFLRHKEISLCCFLIFFFCPINAILASFDVLVSETNLEESVDISVGSQTGFEKSVVRMPFL